MIEPFPGAQTRQLPISPLRPQRLCELESWELGIDSPLHPTHRLRGRVVDRVEQELERRVRLGTEGNLRTEHEHAAPPEPTVGNRDPILQILLTPRPSAAKGGGAREPRHTPGVARAFGADAEDGAVVE